MSEQPALFWGLIVSFFIGNIMLLVLNIPLIGLWVSILNIPYRLLYPAILVFIVIGVYSVSYSPFDIYLVAMVGVLGVVLSVLRFQAAPLLLGFVLGPLMEENLRRALLIARGDLMVFVDRPISFWLLMLALAIVLWSVFGTVRQFAKEKVLERERAQAQNL